MKILIADDEPHYVKIISAMVRYLGHEAIPAAGGAAALTEFLAGEPQVILSDWVMPEIDGLEFCRKVRRSNRPDYVYFMLLTGMKTTHEDYLRAMEAGADEYITKPVDSELLRVRLVVAERILRLTHQVRDMQSLVPVCSSCRRIRRPDGAYIQFEQYFQEAGGRKFSHGICPECAKKQSLA